MPFQTSHVPYVGIIEAQGWPSYWDLKKTWGLRTEEQFIAIYTCKARYPWPVPRIIYPNRNIDILPYNTRHNNILHIEFTRTKTLQDSFLIKGPKYWNTLPTNLTDCITIKRLPSQLKQHLLTAYE